jgi:hypothetical protein
MGGSAESLSAGWTCWRCGGFVGIGMPHACSGLPPMYVETPTPPPTPGDAALQRCADALDRLVTVLERMDRRTREKERWTTK